MENKFDFYQNRFVIAGYKSLKILLIFIFKY